MGNHGAESPTRLPNAFKSGQLKLPDGYKFPDHHGAHDSFTSVRTAQYRGKSIRVETIYKMTIDGKPVTSHVMVLNNGAVHCHALPNYMFPSALDMARGLIDATDFIPPKNELKSANHDSHGGHM